MENAASIAAAALLTPNFNLNVGTGPNELAINFETVIGTRYNDTIIGTAGADKIDGGLGADTLVGHGGADKIFAGYLAGSLTGGDSAVDTIRFDAPTDSGFDPLMGIRDHQLDAAQAPAREFAQEACPDWFGFGGSHFHAHNLAPAVRIDAHQGRP